MKKIDLTKLDLTVEEWCVLLTTIFTGKIQKGSEKVCEKIKKKVEKMKKEIKNDPTDRKP